MPTGLKLTPPRGADTMQLLRFYRDNQLPVLVSAASGKLVVTISGRLETYEQVMEGSGEILLTIVLQCYVNRSLQRCIITLPPGKLRIKEMELD